VNEGVLYLAAEIPESVILLHGHAKHAIWRAQS